ncbi:hypothetical protein pb186bvf_016448 [Paramecium bursaria]
MIFIIYILNVCNGKTNMSSQTFFRQILQFPIFGNQITYHMQIFFDVNVKKVSLEKPQKKKDKIKQESKDEKEKMLKLKKWKKRRMKIQEQLIPAQGGDNEQNIKRSQAIDIQDILNINIREKKMMIAFFDQNEESEESEEELTPKSTKESLQQLVIKALEQDLVTQIKNKGFQLTKNDYLNFMTRDFDEQLQITDHKAM